MPNFYRFNSPFPFNRPYPKNLYYNIPPKSTNYFSDSKPKNDLQESFDNNSCKSHISNNTSNSAFTLELFGLHLYFDDILILGLLFFLYKEEVKDEGLFLALVMLLIS